MELRCLAEALGNAAYDPGYSHEALVRDFAEGRSGEICFTYNGIRETLSYVPIKGTDWLLTYLIRESVISENITQINMAVAEYGPKTIEECLNPEAPAES